MTYSDLINRPNSKKITLVEIDAPIQGLRWINYQPGIWYTRISPGSADFEDDRGNTGYWEGRNDEIFNIQSLNVDGTLYSEVGSVATVVTTDKSWYYNKSTTDIYVHFEDYEPPEIYFFILPGAAIGFSHNINTETNNYYEDIYYNDYILSLPTLSKSKDPLFFGILRFEGGRIGFDNKDGFFDDFASRDLYGQPVRIKFGFEGIDFTEYQTLYTGRVEDFAHDLSSFTLNVADQRKMISRNLPAREFNEETYPDMDSKYYGTPIPIAFGDVIKAPAYRISPGVFQFCDTEFNSVTSGITVYDSSGEIVTHGGSGVSGSFTIPEGTADGAKTVSTGISAGTSTITLSSNGTGTIVVGDKLKIGNDPTIYECTEGDDDVSDGGSISITPLLLDNIPASETAIKLIYSEYTVSFNVSIENGLDIISDVLDNYEGVEFNAFNYDLAEWAAAKTNISNSGIWIGSGNIMSTSDVIQQICVDNNGVFEPLADGKYTFRLLDPDRTPIREIRQDEKMQDPSIVYESDEYLTSVKVNHSKDISNNVQQVYTNTSQEREIYGRYRQYKEQIFDTALVSSTDAETLSERILERSNFIYPTITLQTKTQNSDLRVLDVVEFEYVRENGNVIVPLSTWEVLGVNLDLTGYYTEITIRQIAEI